MAKLTFRHGPMNSGKSTALLQVAYNYQERGMRAVIVKPEVDTKSSAVLSRLNVEGKVDWAVMAHDSIAAHYAADVESAEAPISCILVDEAQFLTPTQIDELFHIVVGHNVPVIAYGIRTDFLTHSFPGSRRLLELSHSIEELKTICGCNAKALFNARKIDGDFTAIGDAIAIDGATDSISYEPVCGRCYYEKVGPVSS